MKKRNYIFLLIAWFLTACSLTRHLNDNEYLLDEVSIESDTKKFDTEPLEAFLKQRPNRKILFLFRFHLWAYYFPDEIKIEQKKKKKKQRLEQKNESRRRKGKKEKHYRLSLGEWMKEVVGEPPVIYNPVLTKKTTEQLLLFLHQNGYFNAAVTDTVIFKKKKVHVKYLVHPGKLYTVRKVRFSILDTSIKNDVIEIGRHSLIHPGKPFQRSLFEEERIRFANAMKNAGYYTFNSAYIEFKADSSIGNHKIDITTVIKARKDSSGNIVPFKKWVVKSVILCPKGVLASENITIDSINNITCQNLAQIGMRKEVLDKNIFIRPGDYYSLEKTDYTRRRLGSLNNFRYINIKYEQIAPGKLQAVIELAASPKHALSLEATGTNRAGNLGINGSINYQNKNTFHGAEILNINILGGLEAQKLTTGTNSQSSENQPQIVNQLPFNTIEYGPNISIKIPELFLPVINKNKLPKYYAPQTSFSASYNFQQRPDYTRNITLFSYAYNWKSKNNIQFHLQPAEINSVKIDKTPDFENRLRSTRNSYLINSYTNHLISAGKFTLSYSNVSDNIYKNFFYIRTSFESGGNLLYLLSPSFQLPKNENNSYLLFGIPYSHYLKFDVEYTYHSVLTKSSSMVYRLYSGVGQPLKNLTSLPFEKSYFGGGANGIRAWTIRSLGPGGLPDTTSGKVDQIGDIQLEANMEYRFDIISSFKGALFVDAGNIWLHKKNSIIPQTAFNITDFYKVIAIGSGVGIRYDMDFLIFRLDMGIPLKDPSLPEGERWFFQSKNQTNLNRRLAYGNDYIKYRIKPLLNIAIGYPF